MHLTCARAAQFHSKTVISNVGQGCRTGKAMGKASARAGVHRTGAHCRFVTTAATLYRGVSCILQAFIRNETMLFVRRNGRCKANVIGAQLCVVGTCLLHRHCLSPTHGACG